MAEKTLTREQYLKELPEIVKNMDGWLPSGKQQESPSGYSSG